MIINTIRIMILIVPTKSGENHPDVKPRDHHARNVVADVAEEGGGEDGDVVEVPGAGRVGGGGVGFDCGEAADMGGWVVSCKFQRKR